MIIGVLNIKGGVGKTTTSMALATAIQRSGKDVLVFDTDPQGSATLWAQAAEDNEDKLPFDVLSKNQAEIRRIATHRPDKNGEIIIIDTPPSGAVINEVIKASDFVVIPSTSSPVDLQQTVLTCASCQDQNKEYGVLIVMARKGTMTLEAFRKAIEEWGAGIFDTQIPLKEVFKSDFGHSFPSNLQGYEDVWNEIQEVEA